MDLVAFWHVIDQARTQSEGDGECLVAQVEHHLYTLPSSDIEQFTRIYLALHHRPSPKLLQALEQRIGFVSDDDFCAFRAWLIARGEAVFCAVTRQPDLLREFLDPKYPWQLDDLSYAAERVYARRRQGDLRNALRVHQGEQIPLEEYSWLLAPAV